MAKLRELLEFKSLRNLKLVTNTECLDVNVGTVTVMEVPDVIQWLKGDDFLITSLFLFPFFNKPTCIDPIFQSAFYIRTI